jgi:hypothetical protein
MTQRVARQKMVRQARHNSGLLGIPFNITFEDVTIPERCPVLGIKLQQTTGRRGDCSPTLARLVPRLGYVKGNVIVTSWRANRLKSDASADDMVRMAEFFGGIPKAH